MATPAQINANRANAQKSTGPRSQEGKSVSRFNALQHGLDAKSVIIPGEDPAEYEQLAQDYQAEFRPLAPPKPSTSTPCSAPIGTSAASKSSRPRSTAPSSPKPPLT